MSVNERSQPIDFSQPVAYAPGTFRKFKGPSMSWIFFSIITALIWAFVNIIDKYTLTHLIRNPLIPILALGVAELIIGVLVFVFHGITKINEIQTYLILAAAFCYGASLFFYYQSVFVEEISRVAPLYFLIPLFVIMMATPALYEKLSLLQHMGVLLLVSGAILLSFTRVKKFHINRAFFYMIAACIFYAGNQVLTKYLLCTMSYWEVFAYVRIGIFLWMLPYLIYFFPVLKKAAHQTGKKLYIIIGGNQCLNLVGVLCLTIALTTGYTALVNALIAVQSFFVLMLTIFCSRFFPHFLEEPLDRSSIIRKIIFIGMMFVGVILVGH